VSHYRLVRSFSLSFDPKVAKGKYLM
jgi:hypothetical protein